MSDPLREYVVLPRDPTLAMLEAGFNICGDGARPDEERTRKARAAYANMIAVWSTVANRPNSKFPPLYYRHPIAVTAKDFHEAMERSKAIPTSILQENTRKAVEQFRASEF